MNVNFSLQKLVLETKKKRNSFSYMNKEIYCWLKEGKQNKVTSQIKQIAKNFSGDDLKKVVKIINFINKEIEICKDQNKVLSIFAQRSADQVLRDKFSTGCHDIDLLFVTFARAVGLPAKYICGIDKLSPKNTSHCFSEVYISDKWFLVDVSRGTIEIHPEKSTFYKNNFVIGIGFDSWDIGIRSFKDWKGKSQKIEKSLIKINKF